MMCPTCQHALRAEARFCDSCGSSITGPDAQTFRLDSSDASGQSAVDPLIGRLIDTKYEVKELLGEGGMGKVYRARRVRYDDEVAIKVLRPQFATDPPTIERFRREARAAARLHHPNIVTIYDDGEAAGDAAPAYIVMELVEGTSLRLLLRREGRLEVSRAITLIRDVCAGVGAAHRRNIVHRDIKPDNIIVLPPDEDRERETAKVVDFGIAKICDLSTGHTLTQTGTMIGTPFYMSPEQCRGESLDVRSDVYSLAALFYEMLAGTPPFVAQTPTGVISKHLFEPPPHLPSELSIPRSLEEVIQRALSKDPRLRQESATTLSREIQEAERDSAGGDRAALAPLAASEPDRRQGQSGRLEAEELRREEEGRTQPAVQWEAQERERRQAEIAPLLKQQGVEKSYAPAQNWTPPPPVYAPARLPNNMVLAIIAIVVSVIFCCLPHGIIPLIFAMQVNKKASAGDMAGAQAASKNARTWGIISIVVSLVWFVIALIINLAGAR